MQRDITWSVNFEVCINCEEARFDDLTEGEQREILDAIAEDSYCGTFLGDEE